MRMEAEMAVEFARYPTDKFVGPRGEQVPGDDEARLRSISSPVERPC